MKHGDLICLITGASSGIGKALAMAIASSGYRVILLAKNERELSETSKDIIHQTGNSLIEYYEVDLSLQKEIRLFAEQFNSKYPKLDLLINNAAVNLPQKKFTNEGIEYTFTVNHLSPFLITNLLLESLKKSDYGQIINVVSNGEKYANFDLDNLQAEKRYDGVKHYCLTKRCNLMFSYELARRLENKGITSNAIHPGGVRTNIMKNYRPFSLPGIVWKFLYPSLKTPNKVAQHFMNLYNSGTFQKENGKYFFKEKMVKSSPASYNREYAEILWGISEKLTHIDNI